VASAVCAALITRSLSCLRLAGRMMPDPPHHFGMRYWRRMPPFPASSGGIPEWGWLSSRVPAFAPQRRAASQSGLVRVGRISVAMLNLFHIDLVVVLVRADPLDPHDALLEIDGDD